MFSQREAKGSLKTFSLKCLVYTEMSNLHQGKNLNWTEIKKQMHEEIETSWY